MRGGGLVRRYFFWAVMVFVANFSGVSRAADIRSPCPNDGYISAYMVPSARIAESIYRAVARGLYSKVFEKYPIVIVGDEGDHWSLSQKNNEPPPKPTPDTVIVSMGGGQLNMDIDKCTGRISHAAFNR